MSHHLRRLTFVACTMLAIQAVGEQASTTEAVRSRIQLLPRRDVSARELREYLQSELKDNTLAEATEMKSFPKWKVFEDEQIAFRYPDHPLIKVEVKTPNDPISVMGDPVRSAEHTYFRTYRLALGEHTYGLLLLDKADAFDDGICFCGEVAYQKYVFHNGSLCRFDFLADGNVKKVQMLCNGFRVVAFEWTHLPMPQDVYVDLALSVALKAGPCDQASMRKTISATYGFYGRLGFLEKGMSRIDIISLVGPPEVESDSLLTYVRREGRRETTIQIPLKHGRFDGFEADWRKRVQLPAERGSVDWIVETVKEDSRSHASAGDSEGEQLPPETIQYMFDRFVEIGPTVQDGDWDRLCMAINGLRERGHTDERVLPIVRQRFREADVCQHHAAWLLHECDPEGSRDLFAERIRLTLDEARKKAASEDEEEAWLTFGPYGDLDNLLCFLGKSHAKRKPFILEAMDHPHPDIRSSAYCFWDCIPTEDARPRLVRGLEDENDSVREEASRAFAKSFGSRDDLPLLKKCASKEKDELVIENLETAIARVEGEEQ